MAPTRKNELSPLVDQLSRYRAALAVLEGFGLSVSPASRLRQYERRLAEVADPAKRITLALAEQLTFDLREIDEITSILEAFDQDPSEPELERLRLLHKGHEHPDVLGDARARDAQYELFLGAILKKAGRPVQVAEPDLVIELSKSVQVAAKRPTSAARLDDRLRHAVTQIERRPDHGLVAISLDHVVRPPGKVLEVASEPLLAGAVADIVSGFLASHLAAIAKRVRGRRVAGVLFTTRLPGRALSSNRRLLGTSLHTEVLADPGTETHGLVSEFADLIEKYLE